MPSISAAAGWWPQGSSGCALSPAQAQASCSGLDSSKKVLLQLIIILHKVQDFSLQFTGTWSEHPSWGFKHRQAGVHSWYFGIEWKNVPCLLFYLPLTMWNVSKCASCLDFYNSILPFQKRISLNSAEQIRITRNSSLHWIVKRNTWMQHRPKMSSFSKRTRTYIKGKVFPLIVIAAAML